MNTIERTEGRRAFGSDPNGYHDTRPGYPEEVFDILQRRCGLTLGSRTLEIGAGTGLSTRRLLELGSSPLVAVEPDERLAHFLTTSLGATDSALDVRVMPFEQVDLATDWFDLATSASAFHWLDEVNSLHKIASALRTGGWWAVWWNLLFDGSRTDEFEQATRPLLKKLSRGPAWGSGQLSFALDKDARIGNLLAVEAFSNIQFESLSWTQIFDTARIQRLYATFSAIARLERDDRNKLLDDLGEIAEKQFGGEVEIQIMTPIYTAQRF